MTWFLIKIILHWDRQCESAKICWSHLETSLVLPCKRWISSERVSMFSWQWSIVWLSESYSGPLATAISWYMSSSRSSCSLFWTKVWKRQKQYIIVNKHLPSKTNTKQLFSFTCNYGTKVELYAILICYWWKSNICLNGLIFILCGKFCARKAKTCKFQDSGDFK